MTDSSYTHITILADRTGSMSATSEAGRTRATDTTAGIHEFIRAQAALPGRLTVSLVDFMCVWDGAGQQKNHIRRIAWLASPDDHDLITWVCTPYGNTPLLDAVGMVITDTGAALAELQEDQRPGKVVFLIATDGEENSSHDYTLDSVKRMVEEQERDYGWQFVFIGVEIDAFAEGRKMAFSAGSTMASPGAGIGQTYAVTSNAVGRYRAGGQSVTFTDKERDEVASKGKHGKGK